MKDLQETIDAVSRAKICARNYKSDAVPEELIEHLQKVGTCLLYTSPSPRD